MSESWRGPARRVVGIAGLAAAVGACSPTFDWREVRPPGTGVQALFPCKPRTETRSVALAGRPVSMTMVACEAGGAMFGLASADTGDAARAEAVIATLREAQAGNLGAPAQPIGALAVTGADARPEPQRFRIDGKFPDGQPVRQHLAYFARGTRVYQAAVLAPQAGADTVDTFFEGIRVLP